MLQPTLLLVEIILVGVTGYLLWMVRRTLTEAQKDAAELIAAAQTKTAGVDPVSLKMAQDVSVLLNDLQRTAGTVQADWVKRRQTMQSTLARAEAIEERLRDLLAQADSAPAPPAVAAATAPPVAEATLADGLQQFRQYLLHAGSPEKTVTRRMGHVTGFAAWWGGHRYEQVSLTRLGAESVEAYLNHLRNRNYQPGTINRKAKAIWAFRNWLNNICLAETPVAFILPSASAGEPQQPEATVANRRRMVQQLARQGVDHREIAAQTGLEQEAVRILLTIGRNDNGLQV